MAVLGTAVVTVLPETAGFATALHAQVKAATDKATAESSSMFDSLAGAGKAALLGIGATAVVAGGMAIKMAGDFQASMTALVTGAGESEANIKKVSNAILNMAPQLGTSTDQLAKGMYLVESAGYHGAEGINVLKAAAEGAKVGSADLGVVANGLTTILNAYGLSSDKAASMTSAMVEVVARGKTHMADLAGSLSSVLPFAAAAGISFEQVGGALATMTAQGVSAQQASQDLGNVIRSLQNPSAVAVKEMAAMGIQSVDLAKNLGRDGLTGTLDEIVTAITAHMGPGGLVLQSAFNQSKYAAADARIEMSKMPQAIQATAQQFLDGTITAGEWRKVIKTLPVDQANLAKEFAVTTNNARGFSNLLREGSPTAQTFTAALAEMTGGAVGAGTALLLTGEHMATFKANVAGIGKASLDGAGQVQGFALVQKDFNFQLEQVTATAQELGIRLGTWLIPKVEALAKAGIAGVEWLQKHALAAKILAGVIGGALTVAIGAYIVQQSIAATKAVIDFAKMIASATAWVAAHIVGFVTVAAGWIAVAAAATAAFIAENLATLGIIAGVMALVAGIVWVATHWSESWAFIQNVVSTAWDWIKKYSTYIELGLVALLGPLGVVLAGALFFGTHWQQIWADVTHWVSYAVNVITTVVGAVVGWLDLHWKLLAIIMTGGMALIALGIARHIAGIRAGFETVIGWLTTAWQAAWEVVATIFDTALSVIEGAALWLWHQVFQPVFDGINLIVTTYIAVWTGIFNVFAAFISGPVAAVFNFLWHNVVQPVFDGIASTIGGAWGRAQGVLQSGANWLGGVFTDAFHTLQSVIKTVWDTMKADAESVWGKITGTIKDAVNTMIKVINTLIHGINAIVGAVVGKGAEIPEIPPLAAGGQLAGRVGAGFMTAGPMAIVGEGNPNFPEIVVPTDPQFRGSATHLMGTAAHLMGMTELPQMAKGGILGDIGGGIAGLAKDVGKFAANLGGDVLGLLRTGAVDLILNPIFAAANATVGQVNVPFIKNLLPAVEKDIKDWALGVSTSEQKLAAQQAAVGGGPGGPGYSTLTSWLGVPYLWGGGHNVSEAVARATGVDCSGLVDQVLGQTGNTVTQIQIGQAIPDIASALAGDLVFFGSQGAEPHHVGIYVGGGQMIDAPHPGSVVRYDGVGGFGEIDGIRRWPNSPGATAVSGIIGPGTFDAGGWLMPGTTLAHNNTGLPERVLAPGQGGNITVEKGAIQMTFTGPVNSDTAGQIQAQIDGSITRALTAILDRHQAARPGG